VHGFAASLSAEGLSTLKAHPGVLHIEPDAVVHNRAYFDTQKNATWALNRISHRAAPKNGSSTGATNYAYKYDSRAGQGVDIYFVDTGINTAHVEFGGRAKWGPTFGGYAKYDGNGHGTHVAGIAISNSYGVAKKAHAIAIKVLADDGSGSMSDVISGLDYVVKQAKTTKRPSIINISLGGDPTQSLDDAVSSALNQGIHISIAAGNDNVDASKNSPARVAAAVTVGATDITDTMAWFSNYGAVVDIFAPGVNIKSTWFGSSHSTHTMSGTSMAAPHAAGMIAYITSVYGAMSPAAMSNKLKSIGLSGGLHGIPSGTRNELLYNGDGS